MKLLSTIVPLVMAATAFGQAPKQPPVFSLAWSEYPSWSALGVASTIGLINGEAGKLGPIEKKYGVDIELKLLDYDSCIQAYNTNKADAVCITNVDILPLSLGRRAVAILPTSTSYGGDALLVPNNITSIEDLKGKTVHGLGKSVSEFVFAGILEANNIPLNTVTFSSMDPAQVSTALQVKDKNVNYGMLWYPFVLDSLAKRKDMKVLATSRTAPFQVIDMVVFGADSLSRTGGEAAAKAICEAYYELNVRLNSTDKADETLVLIGEKFSNVGLADMRTIIQQVRFFGDADKGVAVFSNEQLYADGNTLTVGSPPTKDGVVLTSIRGTTLKQVMESVVPRCKRIGILDKDVTIGYGGDKAARGANLSFDPQYMNATKPARMYFPPSPGNSPPLRKK